MIGHLHYLQYLPRGGAEQRADRWIFSATESRGRQAEIETAVLAPGCLQVVVHTFILAPPEAEEVRDYRVWARAWVAERKAQCLCWFGVLHQGDRETACPHVHVGLVRAQARSPRLLRCYPRAGQATNLPVVSQGGVLLRLPSLVKRESC